jgi:hypothetical protein
MLHVRVRPIRWKETYALAERHDRTGRIGFEDPVGKRVAQFGAKCQAVILTWHDCRGPAEAGLYGLEDVHADTVDENS